MGEPMTCTHEALGSILSAERKGRLQRQLEGASTRLALLQLVGVTVSVSHRS